MDQLPSRDHVVELFLPNIFPYISPVFSLYLCYACRGWVSGKCYKIYLEGIGISIFEEDVGGIFWGMPTNVAEVSLIHSFIVK